MKPAVPRRRRLVAGTAKVNGAPAVAPKRPRWRRRLAAAMVGVVVVAGAGAALRLVWLPHYRPALRPGEHYGIDVSAYQGRIDWTEVARDHIRFSYIKATEGSDFVDRAFAANWTGAERAGIPRGAYHFFTLCSTGAAQARNFLRTAPDDPDMLAPAADLELSGNCHLRPPVQTVQRELRAFVEAVEASTHQKMVAYVSGDFERRYRVSDILDSPYWVRHLLWRPKGDWTIWQVDSWAQVKGVPGGVDLDVLRYPCPLGRPFRSTRRLAATWDRASGSSPAAGKPDRVGGTDPPGKTSA